MGLCTGPCPCQHRRAVPLCSTRAASDGGGREEGPSLRIPLSNRLQGTPTPGTCTAWS